MIDEVGPDVTTFTTVFTCLSMIVLLSLSGWCLLAGSAMGVIYTGNVWMGVMFGFGLRACLRDRGTRVGGGVGALDYVTSSMEHLGGKGTSRWERVLGKREGLFIYLLIHTFILVCVHAYRVSVWDGGFCVFSVFSRSWHATFEV